MQIMRPFATHLAPVKLYIVPVQTQTAVECGLLAIAYACLLQAGATPADVGRAVFPPVKDLYAHLFGCITSGVFTLFTAAGDADGLAEVDTALFKFVSVPHTLALDSTAAGGVKRRHSPRRKRARQRGGPKEKKEERRRKIKQN
jgi:predicted lipid carrier protein YhbT